MHSSFVGSKSTVISENGFYQKIGPKSIVIHELCNQFHEKQEFEMEDIDEKICKPIIPKGKKVRPIIYFFL